MSDEWKQRHATAHREGYDVPLIGIPPDATLETCDLCHDMFPLRDIEFNGTQSLCPKCRHDTH